MNCDATFTPLCFSVDGFVCNEAGFFLKHLARSLSVTWKHHYGEIIGWLWAQLEFFLVQATNVCVRRSRTMWRSLRLEGGVTVPVC